MALGQNRVLGCSKKSESLRPHRVAIASWPTMCKDKRAETLQSLCAHLATAGYEGLEYSASGLGRYFPGDSLATIVSKARPIIEAAGLKVIGATLHVGDAAARKNRWLDPIKDDLKANADLGCEFTSYQFEIAPEYYNTAGEYREDEGYLKWAADRVEELRDITWATGQNFYLEVHVDRITEDPAGLCRIMQLCTVELNGDMSHFLSRGFLKGRDVRRIQELVNHTHVRMARQYGDLSAAVPDPKADWQAKGVTWHMFQFMKPILARGLSSRCISGETGPMQLVTESLQQDATLVPLYRAMARFADSAVQGIVMKVDEPGDLKPWG